MRAPDRLGVGWQALRAHTGRSLLTTLGIVVGVAAVICTMSIGAGAEDEVAERLRSLGASLLVVTPGAAKPGGVRMEAGRRRNLTEADAAAIGGEIPGVEGAAPLVARRLQACIQIFLGRRVSAAPVGPGHPQGPAEIDGGEDHAFE